MTKRTISILLCAMLLVCILPLSVFAVTTIDTVTITNIAAPVDGNGISPGATAGSSAYQVYEVEWYNVTDSDFMSVDDTFQAGKVYRANVWIEACSGYEFKYKDSQTPDVSVTLNGKSVPAQKAYEYAPWAMIVASYTFDPCPPKELPSYSIHVNDGVAMVGGVVVTKAQAGTTVTLVANAAPAGQKFSLWQVTSNVATVADKNSATTTFVMPATNVIIWAMYDHTGLTALEQVSMTSTLPQVLYAGEKLTDATSIQFTTAESSKPAQMYPRLTGHYARWTKYDNTQRAYVEVSRGTQITKGARYRYEVYLGMSSLNAAYFQKTYGDTVSLTVNGRPWTCNPDQHIGKGSVAPYILVYSPIYEGVEKIDDRTQITEIRATSNISQIPYYGGPVHMVTMQLTKGSPAQYKELQSGWVKNGQGERLQPPHVFERTSYAYHALFEIDSTAANTHRFTEETVITVDGTRWTVVAVQDNSCRLIAASPVYQIDANTTPPAHTHTPSGWRTNQVYHYKACTTCGEFLEQDDHSGGTATCSQKGKCTVCGYAYLPENEDHTPDTKWTACGGLYHAKLCKLCGAHCTPEDHQPGPAATDDTPQTCTVCKYVIVPAKNHKHQMKAVEANAPTCTHTGNSAYYMCTDCEGLYTDKDGKTPLTDSVLLPALGHTPSDVWGMDDVAHWLVCTTCNTVMEETKTSHQFAGDQCTVCGYKKGSQTDPESTEPVPGETGPGPDATEAVPHPTEDGNGAVVPNIGAAAPEPEKTFSIGLMIALGAVFFAAAVTVTVIILKKKKQ